MNVSQNSGELRKIASEIANIATTFSQATEALNTIIEKSIGESAGAGVQWYGPNAVAFLDNYKEKCPDEFTTAYNNIMSMSNNVESQAESWEKFESQGI